MDMLLVIFFAVMGMMYTSGIVFLVPIAGMYNKDIITEKYLLLMIPILVLVLTTYALFHVLYFLLFFIVCIWSFMSFTKEFLYSIVISCIMYIIFQAF